MDNSIDTSKLCKICLGVFAVSLGFAMLLYSGTGISFLFSRMLSTLAAVAFTSYVGISIFRSTRPLCIVVNIIILAVVLCVSSYAISMAAADFNGILNGCIRIATNCVKGIGLVFGIPWGEGIEEWNGHWTFLGIGGILVVIGTPFVIFLILRKRIGGTRQAETLQELSRRPEIGKGIGIRPC